MSEKNLKEASDQIVDSSTDHSDQQHLARVKVVDSSNIQSINYPPPPTHQPSSGYYYPSNPLPSSVTNLSPPTTAYYQRYAQSPAPFYFPSGYQENGTFMDSGVLSYHHGNTGGYGNENMTEITNQTMYDQMYSHQPMGYGYIQNGYYDNSYPIGYSTNPYVEDAEFNNMPQIFSGSYNHPHSLSQQQQQQYGHGRLNHADVITPYSSELGSNENLCGGLSSGGTGNASPASKTPIPLGGLTVTEKNPDESCPSSAHVRPLDVITPELFQAIHAPTFYKSTPSASRSTNTMYYPGMTYSDFNGNGFGSHSGPASVYGNYSHSHSSNVPFNHHNQQHHQSSSSVYIPPINTLSSMSYQSIAAHPSSNEQFLHRRAQQNFNNSEPVSLSRNTFSSGKELLPSIIGPDGQIHHKPAGSYASLITKALKESESGKMTLAGIYKWIKTNYPYYQSAEAAWQNSIRHNLSLNKCFKKVPRPLDEPGKGGFWALDQEYIRNQEISKRLNNPHCGQSTEMDSFDTTSSQSPQETANYNDSKSQSKKRRNAEFEASKLLEMLIPQEGWEDSVRVVASVVDEIYAATFEQQATINNTNSHKAIDVPSTEENNSTSKSINGIITSKRSKRYATREPKPYSSMSSTMKLPTPILPNASPGPVPASRELQYHQYQPSVDSQSDSANNR